MDSSVPPSHIEWHPIGQTSNQLILYHPPSHALSVRPHPGPTTAGPSKPLRPGRLLLPPSSELPRTPIETIPRPTCPYCSQPLPATPSTSIPARPPTGGYFEILERAHEGSRPPSPRLREKSATPTPTRNGGQDDEETYGHGDVPAKGYYERFFREEGSLGSGAEGSVFLATHVIGGNTLGTYAVKKIAVGTSKEYLVRMLREVRLLEALRHPNIITYHHSWIDLTRFSSFGPPIMALHVLMMYATAGNLDTFLLTRSHSPQPARPDLSAGGLADSESLGQLPKAERIKAFKKRRQSGGGGNVKREETRGVLLLGVEEIASLFKDVVEGLAFLHATSILHLDLKCSNVLLHWEEGKLIPKAMISDFGTSEEMLRGKRERTGHTGTMEYMAPETLITDAQGRWRPSDSHADMWSLGMILHKLLFLHLPYPDTEDYNALQAAILAYPGFVPTTDLLRSCERRHIPRDILILLSKLVDVNPESRPSAEKVKMGLRKLDTRPPLNSFGGIVTRFARPFRREFTPSSAETERQSTVDLSPVPPILALPSPTAELRQLPYSPSRPTWIPENRSREIKAGLLVLKILSLQPSLTGIELAPLIAVGLVVLAVLTFHLDRWSVEVAGSVAHLGVLWAVGGNSAGSGGTESLLLPATT